MKKLKKNIKKNGRLWSFFASMRLAIVTLLLICLVAPLGTIIPQHQPQTIILNRFGPWTAGIIHALQLDNLYQAWWFLALLGLLVANIIICSLERWPRTMALLQTDHLDISKKRLLHKEHHEQWQIPATTNLRQLAAKLGCRLGKNGWRRVINTNSPTSARIFASQGAWSRLAVYGVHLAIIIILSGAIIGKIMGFKGNISLAESAMLNEIPLGPGGQVIPLGFSLRLDGVKQEFYTNGSEKLSQAQITIPSTDGHDQQYEIAVNKPLSYKGITFYLSTLERYHEFLFTMAENKEDQAVQTLIVPYNQAVLWEQKNIHFGVTAVEVNGPGQQVNRLETWWRQPPGTAKRQWVTAGKTSTISLADHNYQFTAKQLQGIQLQVCRDPGIWLVYSGFILLLMSLPITFFVAHRRLWLLIEQEQGFYNILLASQSNKSCTNNQDFHKLLSLCRQAK